MNAIRRSVAIAGVATLAVVVLPASASAETGTTGGDFGHHVVMCAQEMGFDGQHNPGMHQGFAGWDAAHPC